MTARRVHALLAAGLERPDLIATWRKGPEQAAGCGAVFGEPALDGLRKFAGLGAKIRHNGVRETLPLTFRLMSVMRFEIEVFAAYAEERSRKRTPYAAAVADKARDLVAFLGGWLDHSDHRHCLLWDLARHELALDELAKQPSLPLSGTVKARMAARSRPRIEGRIILHEMKSEPRVVGTLLRQSAPPIDDYDLAARLFCYWRPGGADTMEILELDEFGYCLLGLVDDARSLAEISAEMGCGRRATRPFLRAVQQVAATGVLSFDRTPGHA